jgi:tRNA(His) 5'-end guanylyltransferase
MVDSLGDRMKRYESVPRLSLTRRTPVILRFDGKSFHTFTRGLDKPWDRRMEMAMAVTTVMLCKSIQGAKMGYVQSDEISILCTDYDKIETDAWFDYDLQKMVSIGAATASVNFNTAFDQYNTEDEKPIDMKRKGLALFDGRAFNIPREEVCNYFVWRQQDATRNSIQGLGQANFSQKVLHGKSCDQIQEMLFQEKGLNWNNTPTRRKRGVAVFKDEERMWWPDLETPIFTQNRAYIERFVFPVDALVSKV